MLLGLLWQHVVFSLLVNGGPHGVVVGCGVGCVILYVLMAFVIYIFWHRARYVWLLFLYEKFGPMYLLVVCKC